MKKLLSTRYSAGGFNLSMLLLRLVFGLLMLKHGMGKLMNFSTLQGTFYNFLGMGPKAGLLLTIFAEVFCSLFIVLGLFTRLAAIPLIILTFVIIFSVGKNKPILDSELAILFCTAYIVLLFCGPGKVSVDSLMKN
ncbi:MAG: DoxX family protein [Chitinophagaceae bacterium]|nr:DoxX family protein [Chitinophagaceae bacterium]